MHKNNGLMFFETPTTDIVFIKNVFCTGAKLCISKWQERYMNALGKSEEFKHLSLEDESFEEENVIPVK